MTNNKIVLNTLMSRGSDVIRGNGVQGLRISANTFVTNPRAWRYDINVWGKKTGTAVLSNNINLRWDKVNY